MISVVVERYLVVELFRDKGLVPEPAIFEILDRILLPVATRPNVDLIGGNGSYLARPEAGDFDVAALIFCCLEGATTRALLARRRAYLRR